ncbi:MAG: GTPase [Candidatus Heimdallarchaeota archaeon]
MSQTRRKFKWYRFNVARRIRILEGEDLTSELEETIEDIKSKKLDKAGIFRLFIRQLEDIIAETRFKPKQKGRKFDPFHIPRSGDGRVVLFGLSNAGKSTLMNAITNTNVKTGDYLHTTRTAIAGTCEYDKLKIQIIDVPGFLDFKEDWIISKQIVRVARSCDAVLMVIDLSVDIARQYRFLLKQLENARLIENGRSIYKLGIIATKGDLAGSKEQYTRLKSMTCLPMHPITIKNENSLVKLKEYVFNVLDVMRIYTKPPRREANLEQPFICPIGTTVSELAERIHKDFIPQFRHAKIWGSSVEFPGKQVGLEHVMEDGDIIEITVRRG